MGTEAVWVPLVATALSAGATAYGTNRVAKKQDNIAAQGIRTAAETQRRVNARLNKTLQDTAASTGDASRKKSNVTYLDAIRRKLAEGTSGLQGRGISSEYDEAATGAAGDAQDYAGTVAGLLSRIDAGTMQRQNEGNMLGDFQFDVSPLESNVRSDQFLNNMRLQGVRRNPYIDLAAGAAQGYASNYGK